MEAWAEVVPSSYPADGPFQNSYHPSTGDLRLNFHYLQDLDHLHSTKDYAMVPATYPASLVEAEEVHAEEADAEDADAEDADAEEADAEEEDAEEADAVEVDVEEADAVEVDVEEVDAEV